ncbi:hypothetical protein K438DRAFT_1740076 [Mycena galopus ATCC 62051]|nr:hypothetical protein K438DRAFT_1740076 [Mycena galopus ATCC 62051]
MKFLAYEASLSFLKGAASGNADQSLREEVQTTVDHCIASMTTDSVVGAVVESLECRKTVLELSNRLELANHPDLRIAMRADKEQIATFLVSIFSSQSDKETVLRLEGDSAQHFMDVVQEMLDRGFLMKQEHTRMAFRIIRKLSESRDMLSTSLYIVGVHDREEHPSFGGGFADVYRASYRNQPVALKCMRLFFHGSNLRRIRLKFDSFLSSAAKVYFEPHIHSRRVMELFRYVPSFPSSPVLLSPISRILTTAALPLPHTQKCRWLRCGAAPSKTEQPNRVYRTKNQNYTFRKNDIHWNRRASSSILLPWPRSFAYNLR